MLAFHLFKTKHLGTRSLITWYLTARDIKKGLLSSTRWYFEGRNTDEGELIINYLQTLNTLRC